MTILLHATVYSLLLLVAATASQAPSPTISSPVIVVGFVGGFVKRDDSIHSVVQLATRLRRDYPSGVSVNTFENHDGEAAETYILHLLDSKRDGQLSPEEKHHARIILYGHSWGASQAITLAQSLAKKEIPVLLTIQVDSIVKYGQDDSLIPPNVAEAANFYQPDGLVHGRAKIRAADPSRTRILGNFRFDYSQHHVDCSAYPWLSRTFMKSHIEIECDPKVWSQVEALIRSQLPPAAQTTSIH